jgi:hypothetical protein
MNESLADIEPEPASRTGDHDPAEPQPKIGPSRRSRVSAFLHGSTLLSTTALLVVIEPKAPPFKGD